MNIKTKLTERIVSFNSGFLADKIALKYKAMRSSEFSFFRGTAHLFYEDLPDYLPLLMSPNVWICGDLHLANFGSYRGDNLLAYFDINDFDEATLAPALFDVARLMVSVFVAADSLGFDRQIARDLAENFAKSYTSTLEKGYIRHFEQETATGLMKAFLDKVKAKSHTKFLASRVDNGEKLIIKKKKMTPISKEDIRPFLNAFDKWASETPEPDFFKIIDIALRISGTGSLGVERYIALVQGDTNTKPDVLIDIKEALPSVVEKYITPPQYLAFDNNAARAVELQKRIQPAPPALLSSFSFNDKSFIIRELQPMSDKIDFSLFENNRDNLEDILDKMAKIVAWGQLRSGGREGSSTSDELINFARNASTWHDPLLNFVQQYAEQVRADYSEFAAAYDTGFFNKE